MNAFLAIILASFAAFLSYFITSLSFLAKGLSTQKLQNLLQEKQAVEEKNIVAVNQIAVLQEKLANKTIEIVRLSEVINKETLQQQELRSNFMLAKQKGDELASKLEFLDNSLAEQKSQILTLLKLNEELSRSNAELFSKNEFLNEKLRSHKDEIITLQLAAKQEFQILAGKILEEKSEKFTALNKENIAALLNPLNEDIRAFKKKVEDTYDKESKERFSLQNTVKSLQEQANRVSLEANNLAAALKGQSKMQGNWGEMILDSILEQSGLIREVHYFKEKSFVSEEGKNYRPDFQIHLPDNRVIITDSKVSLVAYDKFYSCLDVEESQKFLAEHVKALRSHIDSLSAKKYDDLPGSLDFVIMFMPIEPAYILAIQHDKQLWSYAYEKRIVMVSPTNLIACLKIINDLWKREAQSKNALEIVSRGELLYEKFVGFTESMQEVGKNLDSSKKAFDEAMGKLSEGRGNLIDQATKLKNLGLKSDKKIAASLINQEEEIST